MPAAAGDSEEQGSPRRAKFREGGIELSIGARDLKPRKELSPEERKKKTEADDAEQLLHLKRVYGISILLLMAIQLIVVNGIFGVYAALGYDWRPPSGAVQVWLAATFVQIVSVVVVITRSLFPTPALRDGTSEKRTRS